MREASHYQARYLIKPDIIESIVAYVNDGLRTGGFLEAVLCNELLLSVTRADSINRAALPLIVEFIFNNVPASLWGSPEAVKNHLLDKQTERLEVADI